MLPTDVYIRVSLMMNLFYLRIMKEHSFFMETSFTPKDANLSKTAGYYKKTFESLLQRAVNMGNGAVSADVLYSGQFFTQYTLDAEIKTQYLTGTSIDSSITVAEQALKPGSNTPADAESTVSDLNRDALAAATALAGFKQSVLNDVLACRIFTTMYPHMLEDIQNEARDYISALSRLQNRANLDRISMIDQEVFWDGIMADHSRFIRGMLDPTEAALIARADRFAGEFDALAAKTEQAEGNPAMYPRVTMDNLEATEELRDFKSSGASGILQCKVRSVIPPLLADHVLREANHYIHFMQTFPVK